MAQDHVQRLIQELARLPGVGERSAARLAFYIIKSSHKTSGGGHSLARDLAAALVHVADHVGLCELCGNLAEAARCSVCEDRARQPSLLCVVEGVEDLRAVEQCGAYRGLYHVLHGALAPLDGIGPDELRLPALAERVRAGGFAEVILATNSDVDGDVTALYITKLLKPTGVRVTRLASGIPLGGELEYIDRATLNRAIAERRDV